MENFKKYAIKMLYPPLLIMVMLIPIAAAFLICSMVFIGSESEIAIISYVLAAYTLTVWCMKIPQLIALIKRFKNENRHIVRWNDDLHFRMKVSLYASVTWNTAYAIFQLCLGFYHHTFWYYSLASYYFLLALMRFYLSKHTRKNRPGEKIKEELLRYRSCGIILLLMNLALALIIFFMLYWNRTFRHHEITAIAMATYTFTTFTLAIINIIKYRKYESPVASASKAIALAAACVSMLTLTTTMITAFGKSESVLFRRVMIASLGGAISVFIITMAIYMIARATKSLKALEMN